MQGQRAPEEMTLGALTLAFVQAAPLSEVTMIRVYKWWSGLNLIVSQVLQVVNPSVSYTTHTGHSSTAHKTRYQGVAISLKEFVRAIDKYNIQHDGESKIRQRLRGHPRCDTRKKQYFNVVGSTKTCIDRNDEGSIRCLTCVCVPADEFSQEVFDVLQDGQKMTSDLQDDEVEGTYDSDVYYRIQYLQLHACSPSLGVSPDHATVEESGINRENI